ncbi:MAG: GDP-mannose 4,6-dehydratase [Deltaproteobacteria bacterium]|nr:GDP-mannose 4,6-dehydratase [Deltaproteobacteria bacterium]
MTPEKNVVAKPGQTPTIGLVASFDPRDKAGVEQFLEDMRQLGVKELRIPIRGFGAKAHQSWFEWLFKRVSQEVGLLPSLILEVPEASGLTALKQADQLVLSLGRYFDCLELCFNPRPFEFRTTRKTTGAKLADEIGKICRRAKVHGKRLALGVSIHHSNWEGLVAAVADNIDVLGVQGFLGNRRNWQELVQALCGWLARLGLAIPIWITETGYSTWQYDEYQQAQRFQELLEIPVEKFFWYAGADAGNKPAPTAEFPNGEYLLHCGLKRRDGAPKLLFRTLVQGGLSGLKSLMDMGYEGPGRESAKASSTRADTFSLITGGAGFIGTNLARRLLAEGRPVMIYDNLSRPGVEQNLRWLKAQYGEKLKVKIADMRNPIPLKAAVERADQVFHLAAQAAVTTSLANPAEDFDINLRGTINLLEALRLLKSPPPLVFTSTNKVYGPLEEIGLRRNGTRYEPSDPIIKNWGVDERRAVNFCSPYGCSKGASDLYILDYSKTYGLPAVVLRMSCIYGPHQLGTEDQGWVAHFLIRALRAQPITIFGDGFQVRDILYVEDLVNALLLAAANMEKTRGQAFNMGGGPANAVSLIELLAMIKGVNKSRPPLVYSGWRQGDQKFYISDTRKFKEFTGWGPEVGVQDGVKHLYKWLKKKQQSGRLT